MKLKQAWWEGLVEKWEGCKVCPIGERAKRHVFGKGSLFAQVAFIGEGPGRLEDMEGVPFIGAAGQLLNAALEDAGRQPVACFYTNLVACRPCDETGAPNRAPSETEIRNCSDRLRDTVQVVSPKVVVLLGRVPQRALECAGWMNAYRVFHLEHPAFILRTGGKGSERYRAYVKKLRGILREAS